MDHFVVKKIYETACGLVIPECAVPGVENLFATGKPCQLLYKEVSERCVQVCEKMGIHSDDDQDLYLLLNSMDEICWLVAQEMFRCGMEYQKGQLPKRRTQ